MRETMANFLNIKLHFILFFMAYHLFCLEPLV
jgi:hypothetical protein